MMLVIGLVLMLIGAVLATYHFGYAAGCRKFEAQFNFVNGELTRLQHNYERLWKGPR